MYAIYRFHEYLAGLPEPLDRVGYNHFIAAFRRAMPDIHNSLEEVNQQRRLGGSALEWLLRPHWHRLNGHPSPWRQGDSPWCLILHFHNGKHTELWNYGDNANVQ